MYNQINTCPISNSDESITYIDLGQMPLVNNLNDTKKESLNCQKFPLQVNYYPKSGLSMLSGVVDPNILFAHYLYKSGTSQPYIDHCKEMFHYISKFVTINDRDQFVDIGGNDGTLLKTFLSIDGRLSVLNVDPSSNLAPISRKNGVGALTTMWDVAVGSRMNGTVKVITSTNVFQHTQPIRSFVEGVKLALADDGIWCLEFPYWKNTMETYQYDQVYHEHIYYYLLTPLYDLFKQVGLEIIDVTEIPIHGGSLRVISKKVGKSQANSNVARQLELEKDIDQAYHEKVGRKIQSDIVGKAQLIYYTKNSGSKIAGFGAAAKGCIFLNSSKIDHNFIDYVVDDTSTKQGKFIPGTGIPIVSRDTLINNPPDYMLILAHNFSEYIMDSLRPIYKGKFIVLFPNIKTYE